MTRGQEAERQVEERLRAALPKDEYRIYVNVNWTGPVRTHGPARDGEADAVITHPDYGLLVLEVKSGEPSVDHDGHWRLGPRVAPCHRSSRPRRPSTTCGPSWSTCPTGLVTSIPWPGTPWPSPMSTSSRCRRGHSLFGLGADAPTDLVLDAHALETTDGSRLARPRLRVLAR